MTTVEDFSVLVDARPAKPVRDRSLDDRIDAFADLLAEHHGVASGDRRGWGGVVSVDAENTEQAYTAGVDIIRDAARRAGLPDWPVVDVRVVRGDILDEEHNTPNYPDLVSGAEAAEILGVSRQRIYQLRREHPQFPTPLYELGTGPLWVRSGIEAFAERWERVSGRHVREAS